MKTAAKPSVILGYIRRRLPMMLIILGCFIAGIMLGSITQSNMDSSQRTRLLDVLFAFTNGSFDMWGIFVSAFVTMLKLGLAAFVLAFTIPGVVAAPLCVGYFGFSLGVTLSLVIYQYAYSGLLINLILFAPRLLIAAPAMIVLCAECISLSLKITQKIFTDNRVTKQEIVSMCMLDVIVAAVCVGLFAVSAGVEAVLSGFVGSNLFV